MFEMLFNETICLAEFQIGMLIHLFGNWVFVLGFISGWLFAQFWRIFGIPRGVEG